MNNRVEHTVQTYDWGRKTAYSEALLSRELTERLQWFILMRWWAILPCGLGLLVARFGWLPINLNPNYFVAVCVYLVVANLFYSHRAGRLSAGSSPDFQKMQSLLLIQMLGDFAALSILTYACGSIETPIQTLFLAHIILATLFFERNLSSLIMLAAWSFAAGPLLLEWAQLIPMLTIFDGQFKTMVLGNPFITLCLLCGLGATFFVCWYLVAEISASLHLRESQLEEAYTMLMRMDREKTQAALRATHELKAPFAAIKSYVYTLRDGYCGPLPQKAQKVVERIGQRSDQLTRKITDIIHLSNLRTLLVTDVDLVPVELTQLLREQATEAQLQGLPSGVQFINHAEQASPVYVMGSVEHLQTLFANLLQNAIQYSYPNGKIELSMRIKPNRVSVRVKDAGIGIPTENIDKMFQEHFRSNNAVAHYAHGTGLGLPMVKEIVRLHAGVIHVQSVEGEGSLFTVSFDKTESQGGKHG